CSFSSSGARLHLPLHSLPPRRSSDLCRHWSSTLNPNVCSRARAISMAACSSGVEHRHEVITNSPLSPSSSRGPISPDPCHACLRSEEHTSELQSREKLVCRLLLE